MRLLLLNIRTDAAHTALGFTSSWIDALAERWDHVEVITMRAGRLALRPNVTVHSLDFDRHSTAPRRAAAFYRTAARVVRNTPIDACFAHMTPLLASMVMPLAKRHRFPVLLWYAHKAVTPTLRIADRVVDGVVSSTPSGYRLPSRKVRFIGQGIDGTRFDLPAERPPDYWTTAVTVGRISAVKQVHVLVEAVTELHYRGVDLRLQVAGEPLTDDDHRYARSLSVSIGRARVSGAVELRGPVPYDEVTGVYHAGWLFLSASDSASLDKALLEAMASGCVVVSSNESFRAIAEQDGLSELVCEPTGQAVADRVAALMALTEPEREALQARCRQVVLDRHGLDALADRITSELIALQRR